MTTTIDYTAGKVFEQAIEDTLGEYGCSDSNPCGGTGYYEPEEQLPFRVLYADGASCELFATAEEAINSCRDYVNEMPR